MKLNQIVEFKSERLFNGAVNIDWFTSDPQRADLASEAFVFHGPTYHGVKQEEIGYSHGHKLVDTASFIKAIIDRCVGVEDQPFTLAIAGYGTGKSHLGLTIASLMKSPNSKTSEKVLHAISNADKEIACSIQKLILDRKKPTLVVALNGMKGFDLTAEIVRQIIHTLKEDGHDTKALDDLRPRFKQAISLVEVSNEVVREELVKYCSNTPVPRIIEELGKQEEVVYKEVHEFFEKKGMPIRALSGDSVKDIIDIAVKEYCGKEKPYGSILILFDEFGKYTEFATVKSQIAGTGVLQDLFESVQSNSSLVCFVGFIQFELNAYVGRVASEFKNEIVRYVTRYQSADKLYLSINLETLIANLIEKKRSDLLNQKFDTASSFSQSKLTIEKMSRRFPIMLNYRAWNDQETFHSVIRKGCWPLSPYTTWLLFYLTSAGKHLQERSALALLSNSFKELKENEIEQDWLIHPVDICSEELIIELMNSEESGQQGSIAHSFSSVIERYATKLSKIQLDILKSILLGSKLGLINSDKNSAIDAISDFCGASVHSIQSEVAILQEEFNVIEWDETFNAFEILGDAVPRAQFISFLKQKVKNIYSEKAKSELFTTRTSAWDDILHDYDCDFAEENKIYTQEWKYKSVKTNIDYLAQNITLAADRWQNSAIEVDQNKGTLVYCYAEQSRSENEIRNLANKALYDAAKARKAEILPIIIVVLHDSEGILGQYLAEDLVIEDIEGPDKVRFGNLITAHKEKLSNSIGETLDGLIKMRFVITMLPNTESTLRLNQIGKLLFSGIYKSPISFPFDGFSTARGNAADSCFELTSELFHGRLDFGLITTKATKVKNRAIAVLKESWGIFNRNGLVSRRPAHKVISHLFEIWDEKLNKDQKISVFSMMNTLCAPPYGANIASAGLVVGVYVAPRLKDLFIMKSEMQLSVESWVQEELFRGKFVNITNTREVYLVKTSQEVSNEWETLLDGWELTESYISRVDYYQQSLKLQKRIPVPPIYIYREQRLVEKAKEAEAKIKELEQFQAEAWNKIDKGFNSQDCGYITWGTSLLKNLFDKMKSETPLWTDDQISEINDDYWRARQHAIDSFDEWLTKQFPKSNMPVDVGNFKNLMLRKIGLNLKNINLEDQYKRLEEYTENTVKRTELIVDARSLSSSIKSWLSEHQNALRSKRISEVRILKEAGAEFLDRIADLIKKGVNPSDFKTYKEELTRFISQIENIEEQLFNKASDIWNSTISNSNDLISLSIEVDSLISSFEGLDKDLEDLVSIKRALRLFIDCNETIVNGSYSWDQFKQLEENLTLKCEDELSEEEIPWNSTMIIKALIANESFIRIDKSNKWMNSIRSRKSEIRKMNAIEANQFLMQISAPPLFVTDEHKTSLAEIFTLIDERINNLSIDYLIEKFKELSYDKRVEFFGIIGKLIKSN